MKAYLKRSQALRGLKKDLTFLRHAVFSGQRRRFRQYLQHALVPALHIGVYRSLLPGWLNTDINPVDKEVVYMDATAPFPAPSASFKYVFAEHVIEHVGFADGLAMIRECRRVLVPGGVLRISTPDLAFLLKLHIDRGKDSIAYLDFIRHSGSLSSGPLQEDALPALVINNAFRAWGHQFLYDEPTLIGSLLQAGFRDVRRVQYGASSHEPLNGIERHGETIRNEEIARMESMIIEAVA